MQKLIIACVLAAFVFAGCSKPSHTESRQPLAGTEPSMTEAKNDMDKEFEGKVNAIDEIGQEVIENIRTEASKAISEIQSVAETAMKTTTTIEPTTTTTAPEPKMVELDIQNVFGDKEYLLRITSATRRYDYNILVFSFTIDTKKSRLSPDRSRSCLIDKSGMEYKLDGFWHGGGKGEIGFQNITDFSDLSTVTLTYAFEGYDTVTVTFDIPGI